MTHKDTFLRAKAASRSLAMMTDKERNDVLRDVADAKRVLVDSLKTVYHTRIAYPELKKEASAAGQRPGLFGSGLHLPRRHPSSRG